MTLPMIIALAVTVLMIILIMVDKLPFGAPPLLALLLLRRRPSSTSSSRASATTRSLSSRLSVRSPVSASRKPRKLSRTLLRLSRKALPRTRLRKSRPSSKRLALLSPSSNSTLFRFAVRKTLLREGLFCAENGAVQRVEID